MARIHLYNKKQPIGVSAYIWTVCGKSVTNDDIVTTDQKMVTCKSCLKMCKSGDNNESF